MDIWRHLIGPRPRPRSPGPRARRHAPGTRAAL